MPFNANFFWATFFVLLVPHEFSTGACPTPSGLEIVKTHHCVLWHTQLIVCAENVKSWFKSWVFPFTFQAFSLPHTLNCMCVC